MTSNISGMGARRMPTNGATSPTIAATALSAARMAPSVSPRAGRSVVEGRAAVGRTHEQLALVAEARKPHAAAVPAGQPHPDNEHNGE